MYWEEVPSPVKIAPPQSKKLEKSTAIKSVNKRALKLADRFKDDHVSKKVKLGHGKKATNLKHSTVEKVARSKTGVVLTAATHTNDVQTDNEMSPNDPTELVINSETNINVDSVETPKLLSNTDNKTKKPKSKPSTPVAKLTLQEKINAILANEKAKDVVIPSVIPKVAPTIAVVNPVPVEEVKFLTLNDITLVDSTPAPPLKTPSQFSGNIDDTGSVASGVLEEDICFECGVSTLCDMQQNNVIMCDICDAEYHLKCVGLERIPRTTFVCPKCDKEALHMNKLKFNVTGEFQITKRNRDTRAVVYSPSKPLALAWEECLQKGLMVVSEVFSYELMQKLTHGRLDKLTKSGRVAESWLGATEEVGKRLHSSVCEGLVDREGRYDLRLPQFVVDQLELDKVLGPILEKLSTIMGTPTPQVRTHNVVFVPVGSKPQKWHVDDTVREGKTHRYFTILIHLNSLDSCCGGTEMWIEKQQCGDMVRSRPGDAFVFNGSLLHRGQANLGKVHRFFYYASFACKADTNTGNV